MLKTLVLCFCFSLALAKTESKFELPKELVEKLKYDLKNPTLGAGGTTAVINEFADKLFINVDILIRNSSLDPLGLAVIDESFLGSEIKLDNGKLIGLGTVHRYQDVLVNYESQDKLLKVTIPMQFDVIEFTYDYLVRILLLPYSGGVTGKLSEFKMNYVFTLNFDTYHITLSANDIMDSGHVDLTFQGNIIDIVVNLLSEFFTTILHPIIVGIIQVAFSSIVNVVVDNINEIIDSILHPTVATTITSIIN